jgi:predicted SnoaL-like aldol condensation-catalyzing enzyme
MSSQKAMAAEFLELASAGRVKEAYARYVHPDFFHHNPYFPGDRQSLLEGMEENAKQFPVKTYQTLHALEDGDLAVVHGKVALAPEKVYGVIHVFRFADGLIIESWEASQEVLGDSPNEQAVF